MFCAKKSGQDAAPPAVQEAAEAAEAERVASSVTYDTLADARDGKKYKTVKIGGQVWMAENLNAAGGRCYKNSDENCGKYGRLYDWYSAKEACPAGWKLPDTADWGKLSTAVGGKETAGKKLKSKSGWDDNGNGTDEFGFSALPSGFLDANPDVEGGVFENAGCGGNWWMATESGSDEAYYRSISCMGDDVNENNDRKSDGFSVRCLKE